MTSLLPAVEDEIVDQMEKAVDTGKQVYKALVVFRVDIKGSKFLNDIAEKVATDGAIAASGRGFGNELHYFYPGFMGMIMEHVTARNPHDLVLCGLSIYDASFKVQSPLLSPLLDDVVIKTAKGISEIMQDDRAWSLLCGDQKYLKLVMERVRDMPPPIGNV